MITQEEVKELFDYRDGNLWWKKSGPRRNLSKPAGSIDNQGYRRIQHNNKSYSVHRLVWLYHYEKWPDHIDHINHIRDDNRIENLRSVSNHENTKNQSMRITNTSGYTGVFFDKDRNKWRSQIRNDGKSIHLGRFDNIEDAITARKEAELKYNFHENHGS